MPTSISTIPVQVRWRDVIHLSIADDDFHQRTEQFLDLLEHSSFRYEQTNPNTGRTYTEEISGQAILRSIRNVNEDINNLLDDSNSGAHAHVANDGVAHTRGRLTIADHTHPYDPTRGNNGTTTNVIQSRNANGDVLPEGALATSIVLGQDQHRGMQYRGEDGQYHAVSVEAALMHELAHAAYRTTNEYTARRMESAVTAALGGVARDLDHDAEYFRHNSNGGYVSLIEQNRSGRRIALGENEATLPSAVDPAMATALAQAEEQLPAAFRESMAALAQADPYHAPAKLRESTRENYA